MRPEKVDRVRKKRIKAEAEEVKTEAIKIEAVKTEELDEMYDESDSSAAEEFDVAMLRTTELVPMEPLEPTQVLVGSVDPSVQLMFAGPGTSQDPCCSAWSRHHPTGGAVRGGAGEHLDRA